MHLIALIAPGWDFFFVSQTTIRRSRRQAMYGVLGITLGVPIWTVVALLGLHFLLSRMASCTSLITFGGGLYFSAWGGNYCALSVSRRAPTGASGCRSGVEVPPAAVGNIALRWLLTNLANPKAAICFGSGFSLFVSNGIDAVAHLGMFSLILGETLLWFSLTTAVFALLAMHRRLSASCALDFWRWKEEKEFPDAQSRSIRFVRLCAPNHDKVVVINSCCIESYVKYPEVAYDLFQCGYHVMILDQRGHRLSGDCWWIVSGAYHIL